MSTYTEKNHEVLDRNLGEENVTALSDDQYHKIKLAMDEYAENLIYLFIKKITPKISDVLYAANGSDAGAKDIFKMLKKESGLNFKQKKV